jgi:UDP-2,3-diacylglucosamine pyrophosphatase LpxH
MITSIQTQKMVVISDLHLGNPFSNIRKSVTQFVRWAAQEGYDICINGDGLEIAQASFDRITYEVPEFFRAISELRRKGKEVYYLIGNHDIALEHFLEDWAVMKVSPFLNVQSGQTRVRIEHGHIYDPFFVKYPKLYDALTHWAGYLLKVSPGLYKAWIKFEKIKSRIRARKTGIVGEHPSFRWSANELCRRGFDAVIFGHTHHPGEVALDSGGKYFNSGSWMLGNDYIEILDGNVSLKRWTPR